jgi:hypothetical protein
MQCWGVIREALRLSVLASALVAVAGQAAADSVPIHPYRISVGQRIRMWSEPGSLGFQGDDGVVTATDADGLTVVVGKRTELVPFHTLERVDVRHGWRYLRTAAAIGFVVGAVTGALVEDGDEEDIVKSAAIYGAVGAAVGPISAAAIWPAHWVPVELDRIRPPVERPAARLSFSIRF